MNDTQTSVLNAAMKLSRIHGFQHIKRDDIAETANVSTGIVSYYYSIPEMRAAVMQEAVRVNDAVIVCQGLAAKHPIAQGAPEALRREAVELLLK
ncbi:hypothetical protein [Edwardsiella phage MSW-3]|uniref:HTH tetR-type domain-containing protein n=1 Tax=Edwardsiella phage MSW-3 TaxID=1264700 RepID=L0MX88_9CAUD|nr:hypothetical protein G428_gp58 [Edwardsiella phage MSW-3]BAM68879.1 hypothetical protein [Edwardsiella phage MSW-3]